MAKSKVRKLPVPEEAPTEDRIGVGFRYFTRKKATSYGLTGWVRNTDRGEVEGEAQGPDSAIEDFIKDLSRGPSSAQVSKVDHSDLDASDGEKGFVVRR